MLAILPDDIDRVRDHGVLEVAAGDVIEAAVARGDCVFAVAAQEVIGRT